jgi:hypothetical protein
MEFLQPELVIENCAIATMDGRKHDDTGAEHRTIDMTVATREVRAARRRLEPGT